MLTHPDPPSLDLARQIHGLLAASGLDTGQQYAALTFAQMLVSEAGHAATTAAPSADAG